VFPKFPQNLPKLAHCGQNDGDIPNVPFRNISGTLFWFILNFTDSVHCDHTAGNIAKEFSNEPLGNIKGTFFGKIQGFPKIFLIGTFWSHDLVNSECTKHFPSMSHSGTSWVLSLGKFKMYIAIKLAWKILNVFAVYQVGLG
jgi:hypothetical protein